MDARFAAIRESGKILSLGNGRASLFFLLENCAKFADYLSCAEIAAAHRLRVDRWYEARVIAPKEAKANSSE